MRDHGHLGDHSYVAAPRNHALTAYPQLSILLLTEQEPNPSPPILNLSEPDRRLRAGLAFCIGG
jgi:hypothetical protein